MAPNASARVVSIFLTPRAPSGQVKDKDVCREPPPRSSYPKILLGLDKAGLRDPSQLQLQCLPLQRPSSTPCTQGETEAQRGPDIPCHTISSTVPCHLTHTLVPSSAQAASHPLQRTGAWGGSPRSPGMCPPLPGSHGSLTAKGCHPFSVHLIYLKTMKKNHSRLSASAATVIYSLHQSPLPRLAPSFSPKLPKAGVRGMERY